MRGYRAWKRHVTLAMVGYALPAVAAARGRGPRMPSRAHVINYPQHGRRGHQPVICLAPVVLGGAGIPLGLGLAGSVTAIVVFGYDALRAE
ncbi:hypothetical protein KN815_03020 [Streptomyces sp. 4503]|uniref:Uncharacterized protein n=1 Tax=Streptomyces niphimycinicus TaxID=2842201 RepID=A0ABS6C880_9ACTN|nr:hypothetical protein [Streptomyces niphimycinicus]MBU3863105.1 hypothetical protein [Streptomyces niphimycinicus]